MLSSTERVGNTFSTVEGFRFPVVEQTIVVNPGVGYSTIARIRDRFFFANRSEHFASKG
jgi:hypothetical protein